MIHVRHEDCSNDVLTCESNCAKHRVQKAESKIVMSALTPAMYVNVLIIMVETQTEMYQVCYSCYNRQLHMENDCLKRTREC